MEWIISANHNIYNHIKAFNELPYIDWKQSYNFEVGDRVFVYSSGSTQGIEFCAEVLKVNITTSEAQDDYDFWYDKNAYHEGRLHNRFFRLKLVSFFENKISLEQLRNGGLRGNLQGARRLMNENGGLNQLGELIHRLIYSNTKQDNTNGLNRMNQYIHSEEGKCRIIFCNVAYMKNYDALAFEEIPVNGGSYVAETKDAYEKYNFHVCEDGMIRGFVETKYSDGALGGQQKPKQLHIENIDNKYKKEDVIDNVLVVFCAHSPKIGKTVIVGWYKNAQVYRGREHYNGRQFNIMTNYKNAVLLNERNRTMEVPRAAQHENNLGLGQANVWYANKPEHQEYVKIVIEYIESEEEKVSRRDNNIKNTLEDERLNNNLKSVTFDKNYHFEYTDEIVSKPVAYETKKGVVYYKRDRKRAINALSHADYMCEYNNDHESFIRKNDGVRYTEAHHLIPMSQQDKFDVSLDVEENIVSLCSNCHNEIHYGKNAKDLIEKLYNERKEYLKRKGIEISLEKLFDYYT